MIAISLALTAVLYAAGLWRLWSTAGYGCGVRVREAAAFGCGWLALAAALESPLHEWSEQLFVAHMIQHELIMIVAAPLMAVGAPLVAMLWALPRSWRRRWSGGLHAARRVTPVRWLFAPAAIVGLHAVALYLWHLPSLYGAALEHPAVHAVQHASFFGTAVLFWWTIARGDYGKGGYGASVLYVFGSATQGGVLGALLALSQRVWYPAYAGRMPGALTPIEDQQLAGLVMWVPSGLIFTAAGLILLAAWMKESERRTGRYDTAKGTAGQASAAGPAAVKRTA